MALGAGCASCAAVIAESANRAPDQTRAWFLVVYEDPSLASQQWKGAEIARDCGARSFEVIPVPSPHEPSKTRLPLILENKSAATCMSEKFKNPGLRTKIGME